MRLFSLRQSDARIISTPISKSLCGDYVDLIGGSRARENYQFSRIGVSIRPFLSESQDKDKLAKVEGIGSLVNIDDVLNSSRKWFQETHPGNLPNNASQRKLLEYQ